MREPKVVRRPAVSVRSLIPTGTPWSGRSTGASAARRAAASARSRSTVTYALRTPSTASMRSRQASSASTGDASRRRKSSTSWAASVKARSVTAPTCYVRAMPTVEVNGARLHVSQQGTGEDVLLLCGLGDDVAAWDGQTPVFAERYRVTAIDNRGVGQSSLPDGEFTMRDLAADAAGVCDALGISGAHVMGFSMGGAIAQELALARP